MASVPRFDPEKLTSAANDTVTVRRVFGEAYERDGVTVIPVARVWAATGLGIGDGEGGMPGGLLDRLGRRLGPAVEDAEGLVVPAEPDEAGVGPGGSGHGGGGGYGAHVKAVGVYVIDDGGVHWRPAIDVNRVILGGQIVMASAVSAVAAALAVRSVAHAVGHALALRAARG